MDEVIKVASAEKDHLSAFHAFRRYQTKGGTVSFSRWVQFDTPMTHCGLTVLIWMLGLSACLESGRGDKLSSSQKQLIQNLLKVN